MLIYLAEAARVDNMRDGNENMNNYWTELFRKGAQEKLTKTNIQTHSLSLALLRLRGETGFASTTYSSAQ